MPKRILVIAMLALASSACGCRPLGYFLYLIAPGESGQKQKAEFDALKGHSVAVVIFADVNTQYEYPAAQMELSALIAHELGRHVKDVRVIDTRKVIRYQHENIYWDSMPKTQLGEIFGADYILFVSLLQYTTREPGSMNLSRGIISAEVSVYDTSLAEHQSRVKYWPEISVAFPEDDPMGRLGANEQRIRERTEKLFVDKVVKKFYDHKVSKK